MIIKDIFLNTICITLTNHSYLIYYIVTDLSNSITHTEQKKSKSWFEYSSKTLEFPTISYTPLTAYVVEYTPTASGTTPPTPSKNQAPPDYNTAQPSAPPLYPTFSSSTEKSQMQTSNLMQEQGVVERLSEQNVMTSHNKKT